MEFASPRYSNVFNPAMQTDSKAKEVYEQRHDAEVGISFVTSVKGYFNTFKGTWTTSDQYNLNLESYLKCAILWSKLYCVILH